MSNNLYKITFEMLSDWHVGTGAGIPGSVDALLARDADGFPCIPAKTVVGIWRDAMEILTLGLDDGDENNKKWQNWVDAIFGSQPNVDKNPNDTPRPAILSIKPARIDENLRNAIKGDKKLEQTLTFIKPNTAIESESGTAKTDSLRFTEMGRIGSVLSADFELDFTGFDANQTELVKALLTASAGLIERIGGNRRRGSGKCDVTVNCDIKNAISVLESYQEKNNNPLPEFPKIQTKGELESAQSVVSDDWKRIEYSLKLETPVAIVTATLGNVSETLDFIPGTYLLPHLTKALGKGVSKYIASGDFQVLPATISVDGKRGLPVPKVIHYHKVEGGFDKEVEGGFNKTQDGKFPTVYNKITESPKVEDLTYQKKNYREGYISSLDENKDNDGNNLLPFHETTRKILLMHNTVEDKYQRPTSEVGGVFSRQAIAAGQTLKGEIRFKASIEKELDFSKPGGYVRLGTSKKDDYGFAELTIGKAESSTSKAAITNELIVYLASDVLLRNGNLRQTNLACDLKKEIEKTLGANSLKCTGKSLIQVRRIESWHEGWGFPRPTFTAMSAGSVAVFKIENFDETKKAELEAKLKKIELSGIGERRGEGYGQIKFNPRILTAKINEWKVSAKILKNGFDEAKRQEAIENLRNRLLVDGIIGETKFKEFIENLEIATWREEIARAVLKIADVPKEREDIFGFGYKGKESVPPLSQIGGLRATIGKVKTDGSNKNVVTGWLKHLQATSNRKDKWEKGFGKIGDLFKNDNDNEIWKLLEVKDTTGQPIYFNPPKPLISDEDVLKEKLWVEAVKSLFDACARAHKRKTEDNE